MHFYIILGHRFGVWIKYKSTKEERQEEMYQMVHTATLFQDEHTGAAAAILRKSLFFKIETNLDQTNNLSIVLDG